MKRLLLILCSLSLGLPLFAQLQVTAALDSTRILIGDQVRLTYTIRQPNGATIQPPDYRAALDSLEKVELLQVEKLDTVRIADPMLLRQSLLLTSFDSGAYAIPGILFQSRVGGTMVSGRANTVYLSVSPVALDTIALAPIKDIMEEPLKMSDWLPYVLYPLGGLLLFVLVVFLIRKFTRKEEVPPVEQKIWIPAHVTALGKLSDLEKGRIWQSGEIKVYYSQISQIVREYMENRFGFNALESVTHEIAPELQKQEEVPPSLQADVMSMLETADMVKFAKWQPSEEKHLKVLEVAKGFVEQTRGSDVPPEGWVTGEEAEGKQEDPTTESPTPAAAIPKKQQPQPQRRPPTKDAVFGNNERLSEAMMYAMDWGAFLRHDTENALIPFLYLINGDERRVRVLMTDGENPLEFAKRMLEKESQPFQQFVIGMEGYLRDGKQRSPAIIVQGFDKTRPKGIALGQVFEPKGPFGTFRRLGRVVLLGHPDLPIKQEEMTNPNYAIAEIGFNGVAMNHAYMAVFTHDSPSVIANAMKRFLRSKLAAKDSSNGCFDVRITPGLVKGGDFLRFLVVTAAEEAKASPEALAWERQTGQTILINIQHGDEVYLKEFEV